MHRGHGAVPGRLRLREPAIEVEGVEAGCAKHVAARGDGRKNRRDQPVNVKKRHDREAAVFRRQMSVRAIFQADAQRFRWPSGTILGREVVPDVCSTSAMSSPPGCSCRAGCPLSPVRAEIRPRRDPARAQADDPDAQLFRNLDGRRCAPRLHDEQLCAEDRKGKTRIPPPCRRD